jgi:hypothetical protein
MGQLRDRMEQDLKLRGLSPCTQRNYLVYCRKFAAFFMRSPEELGAAEVRAFLLHQIEVEQLATFSIASSASTVTSGQAFSITVTALDPYGNVATGYTGTVHFITSAAAATLPADYTFTAADGGVHTFSVTLQTAGSQTVTATDTHSPSLKGQTAVSVLPVASLSGPATGTVNQALTFTLSATGGCPATLHVTVPIVSSTGTWPDAVTS